MTESFNLIPNKNLGPQDYANLDANGERNTEVCRTMPFEGNNNEMPVMKSFADANTLYFVWCLPSRPERNKKKSLNLI